MPTLFFTIYLFFISLIILDAWESFKYVQKSTWILDAYGFLGPSFYLFMVFQINPSYSFNRKLLALFSIGILELGIQIIRIFDFRIFEIYYFSDSGYAFVLEILEVFAFVLFFILLTIMGKQLLEAFKKGETILPKKLLTFFILNVIIVGIWGIFLIHDFSIQSVTSISLISLIAIFIILFVSEHIRHPEFLNPSSLFNKRKKRVQNNPNAKKDRERIDNYLNKEKPFKQSAFSLKQLSQSLNMPKDYVSEVINHQMGKTFKQYLNESRVQEAQLLFQDKNYSHFSTLGIAYEVGFTSESNFYRSFKKITKLTPKQFKNGIQNISIKNHS